MSHGNQLDCAQSRSEPHQTVVHPHAIMLLVMLLSRRCQVEGAALGIALLRTLAAGGAGGAALTFATTHHRCTSYRMPCQYVSAHL